MELLVRFGLPTALLLALAWYHVRVVKQKDQEISKLNDKRLNEARNAYERSLQVSQAFVKLMEEAKKPPS